MGEARGDPTAAHEPVLVALNRKSGRGKSAGRACALERHNAVADSLKHNNIVNIKVVGVGGAGSNAINCMIAVVGAWPEHP